MVKRTPRELAAAYLDCWRSGDFDTLRTLLADDVTFRGVLGQTDGAEQTLAGLQGMREVLTDVRVEQVVVEGPDVMTWYDLCTSIAAPVPTVNWTRVDTGRITAVRAVFDPRPLLQGWSR